MQNQPPLISQPIVYDGKLGEQYKIFLLNIFLGIITLGIYHYWGKTRQRRYTTSSCAINNDRFEYTGYGIELFWGLIKALFIIGIISIPFFYYLSTLDRVTHKMETLEQEEQHHANALAAPTQEKKQAKKNSKEDKEVWDKLSQTERKDFITSSMVVVGYFIFYYAYLPFVAVYGSLRYRITRTRWRGIRGHMIGSSIVYGIVGFIHTILKIITLGLWIPFADLMTYKYKMKRTFFGSQQALFTPQYCKLFGYHLLTLIIGIGLALAVGILVYGTTIAEYFSATSSANGGLDEVAKNITHSMEEGKKALPALWLIIILAVIITFFARFWYRAALVRMRYNRLSFGNIGFHCTITGWGLFKQLCGNFFILIFTLGLGLPIVIQRRMKFFCRHTTATGDIDKAPILQATGEKDKAAEGISTMFDINIRLF